MIQGLGSRARWMILRASICLLPSTFAASAKLGKYIYYTLPRTDAVAKPRCESRAGPQRAPVMIRRLVLVACLGTARAAGFSQSLVEQPDVSAETYTSDSGAALPNIVLLLFSSIEGALDHTLDSCLRPLSCSLRHLDTVCDLGSAAIGQPRLHDGAGSGQPAHAALRWLHRRDRARDVPVYDEHP
eukprot:scaffold16578_cov70-Phaeocystis_antarctica.AAC.5